MERRGALLEYFHATGTAKLNAVKYVLSLILQLLGFECKDDYFYNNNGFLISIYVRNVLRNPT